QVFAAADLDPGLGDAPAGLDEVGHGLDDHSLAHLGDLLPPADTGRSRVGVGGVDGDASGAAYQFGGCLAEPVGQAEVPAVVVVGPGAALGREQLEGRDPYAVEAVGGPDVAAVGGAERLRVGGARGHASGQVCDVDAPRRRGGQ